MTSLESSDLLIAPLKKSGLVTRIWQAIERNRERHAARRVLKHLMQYDAHMLRDIGIDPRDIEDALNQRSVSVLMYPVRPHDRQ